MKAPWDPERCTRADGTKTGFDVDQAFEKIAHPRPKKQPGQIGGSMDMDPTTTAGANETFRNLRARMNWSRTEVASFLGVSKKAIESYEQGWRDIPDRVWKQLITVAAVQLEYPLRHHRRCWEAADCPAALRESCFSAQLLQGVFCWMTATNSCREAHLGRDVSFMACIECPVVRQFLPELPASGQD